MMLNDKQTYEAVKYYGKKKATYPLLKMFLLAIMGGAFVAMGYLGSFVMGESSKIAAAFIFPVGLILVVFIGGSLFTSDALAILPLYDRTVKIKRILILMGIGLAGNLVGAFIMALFSYFAGFMRDNHHILKDFIGSYTHKEWTWYYSIGSGILCNIVVCGAIIASLRTDNSVGKFLLILFPIALFAAVGFQHIVANFFVFSYGIFANGAHVISPAHAQDLVSEGFLTQDSTSGSYTFHAHTGKFIYENLIPTAIGNWLGGAIILPAPYAILWFKHKKTCADKECSCKMKELKKKA